MGEDFEVETCPNCKSVAVITTYDSFGIVRLSLICRACGYIEAHNPGAGCECKEEELNPWESDPDAWKQ